MKDTAFGCRAVSLLDVEILEGLDCHYFAFFCACTFGRQVNQAIGFGHGCQ